METAETHAHVVPHATFIRIWVVLVALTATLVLVSRLQHDPLAVWAMLTVTPAKATLVFYYFMHLKYERPLLKGMLFAALATLIIFIGLMFLDISSR